MDVEFAKRDPLVAVILTLSGGYLDAFAYVGHGHVFANTMTDNVALLGIDIARAAWPQALVHLPPLAGFVLAVLTMHLLSTLPGDRRRWYQDRSFACLFIEMAFLALAGTGLFARAEGWLIPGITFVATLQTLSFTQLNEYAYTSVMTTGNLRRSTAALFRGLIPHIDAIALREAAYLGMISFSFFVGAALGALATNEMADAALWLVAGMLFVALCRALAVGYRGVPNGV